MWDKWNELFDRVLWVPLRNLKLPERRIKPKYTLEHLFRHEFLLPKNEPNLAGALFRALEIKSSNTLFLLDGLDEVSQDLTGNGSMPLFLDELLSQPNVIITSRPSAKPVRQNVHLELETIGFGPNQVDEYIEKSFTNPKMAKTDQTKVDKVQSFLQKHWLVQGLVRIPIQLDALCYTWEEFDPKAVPNTMTGMYNTSVQKLWKKDIVRLEKVKEGYAEVAHTAEIENKVTAEIALVECLAFNGLHHDIIDFTPEHRDGVVKLCPLQDLPLDETLSRLSFLRTSDTASTIKDRNYHFIHLTFQEYFAAQYFASHPVEFLRKHKYTTRYDIFWRFVAGLLDGSAQAPEFIDTIEKEPLDLLGPTHQRLVMHCLSEISSNLATRQALEERLARWLLFECKFNESAWLASEAEFPEAALRSTLLHESSDGQARLLRSLASRALIPHSIARAVAARLGDEDSHVRHAAITALGGGVTLPDGMLTAVVAQLGDQDEFVRNAAIEALGGRAMLPDGVLTAVAARLEDEDSIVRRAAVETLRRRATLPDGVLKAVAARLEDEDTNVRTASIKALGRRATLPNWVLTAVVAQLGDQDKFVRNAAVMALGGRATLPDGVLTAVAARLEDENSIVRGAAVQALSGRATLPDRVLKAVAARLDDKNSNVRMASVEALGGRAMLPDGMLTAVVVRLEDEYGIVRRAAVEALNGRTTLPDGMLTAVAALLDDKNSKVRMAAIETLGGRAILLDGMLTAVAARLDDKDWNVRMAAVKALGGRAMLPDGMLTAVVVRLEDEDSNVRRAAVEALDGHATLPDGMLTAVAARLKDEDRYVRIAAVETLRKRATLLDWVPTAMAARLEDEEMYVRSAAIEAQGERVTLPDGVLTVVAARLEDEDGSN
ncbi:hypothetical protein MY4038_009322 [Beauveria bassiana]